MTAAMNHPLVSSYLARLAGAAAALPPEQRTELLADIEGHLRDAMAGGEASEADIRSTLERLGPPEELVAEAGRSAGSPSTYAAPMQAPGPWAERPRTTKEVAALVLFAVGAAFTVSIIGAPLGVLVWVPAVVLLLLSTVWSPREKLVGGLVLGVAGSPLLWLLAGVAPFVVASPEVCVSGSDSVDLSGGGPATGAIEQCTGGPPAWLPWSAGAVAIVLVVAWVVVWVRLWGSARRATATG